LAWPQIAWRPISWHAPGEILGLIAQGLNNTVIADRLVISPKTVGNHISNIFSKLQVADRAEAIVRARDAGLGRGG
jgi:DNA-binding NarL/FixJ family response regulator